MPGMEQPAARRARAEAALGETADPEQGPLGAAACALLAVVGELSDGCYRNGGEPMARSGMTVEILGARRLQAQLEDLGEDIVNALRKAVKESAEAVKADTQRDVAKDSRNLHDEVDIKFKDDDLTALVGWHNDTEYYARFLEYGTRRYEAQPALRPALEAERGRYRARLTEEVRKALR